MQELKKTLEMDPEFFLAQQLLWQTYARKGMYEEALAWGKAMAVETKSPESRERDEILRKAYDVSGWKGFERKELELELERQERGDMSAGPLAGMYTRIGDYDQAFKWLEKAYENREASMVWVKINVGFDDLRSDPRFQDLLRRMRLEE